jgi:predicted TIM-barrel fold metal-dependent hydrolase
VPSFDLHQHLWPPSLIAALRARSEPPRLTGDGQRLELRDGVWPADLDSHDLAARIALLDRDGVDVAVISLPPTLGVDEHPELVDAYHEGIAETVAAAEGRLAAFSAGTVRDGFPGVCVGARTVAYDFDTLMDVFAEAQAGGRVLFVHPGPSRPHRAAPGWWPAVVHYTAEQQAAYAMWLARGADAYPELRVLFAILAGGAPIQLERFGSRGFDVRRAQNPNVFFDTASYGRRALELCVATFGPGQLVYGSDVPVVNSRPTAEALAELGKSVANAARVENPSLLLR